VDKHRATCREIPNQAKRCECLVFAPDLRLVLPVGITQRPIRSVLARSRRGATYSIEHTDHLAASTVETTAKSGRVRVPTRPPANIVTRVGPPPNHLAECSSLAEEGALSTPTRLRKHLPGFANQRATTAARKVEGFHPAGATGATCIFLEKIMFHNDLVTACPLQEGRRPQYM
jgi:hypothetical protein